MALHGPLAITNRDGGNTIVGYWSARRTSDITHPDAEHEYECEVTYQGTTDSFVVRHRYSDGALALAAKVLGRFQ